MEGWVWCSEAIDAIVLDREEGDHVNSGFLGRGRYQTARGGEIKWHTRDLDVGVGDRWVGLEDAAGARGGEDRFEIPECVTGQVGAFRIRVSEGEAEWKGMWD